ncbi:helix-turn-helix transcriptional regulator [Photobacterium galatheae]|uniref:AraC family transcriptional regulator n=1 Tax=Photobacterium galatheae TaxID=1654360 RepID=UPI00202CF85D|nr:helix-turn-helix transcriptional regulator [Photobacterium galatheae]MCM0148759.1 helix-turn-helix transcriptional regulator [Photobacterium galatheae]
MTRNTDNQTTQIVSSNTLIASSPKQPVLVKIINMTKGYHDRPHQHDWHQVIYPSRGLLKSRTESHHFYVPHHRALFIPAHTMHESYAMQDASFIGIYLNPACSGALPETCQPIEVSPFLRELILKLTQCVHPGQSLPDRVMNLLAVFEDELRAEKDSALELPMPADRRLQPIVDGLLSCPGNTRTLAEWSAQTGATERTLSRLFKKEVQLTFPQWRQRLRLMTALTLLEQGETVQDVAHHIGYQSVSAFIEAFRMAFKQTPQQFKQGAK